MEQLTLIEPKKLTTKLVQLVVSVKQEQDRVTESTSALVLALKDKGYTGEDFKVGTPAYDQLYAKWKLPRAKGGCLEDDEIRALNLDSTERNDAEKELAGLAQTRINGHIRWTRTLVDPNRKAYKTALGLTGAGNGAPRLPKGERFDAQVDKRVDSLKEKIQKYNPEKDGDSKYNMPAMARWFESMPAKRKQIQSYLSPLIREGFFSPIENPFSYGIPHGSGMPYEASSLVVVSF